MARPLAVLFVCLSLILSFPAGPGHAQTPDCPVLTLDGPVKGRAMQGYISALQDPDWALDIAAASGPDRDRFAILDTYTPDFGYTDARIWLRVCTRNQTADTRDWRLYVRENFFQNFDVFVRRESGRVEHRVSLQQNSPFSARPIQDPELIVPLSIEPAETVEIYIAYWSGGSSQTNFEIQTKAAYETIAATKTAKNFFFYGMMILLILVALAALAVFRHRVFLAYCAYATTALIFVMHSDGVAFQYLWPAFPLFNAQATVFVGSGLIIFGSVYARVFLKTGQRHPKTDKLLFGIIVFTLVLDAVLLPIDSQLLKKLLIMISLLAFVTFIFAGLIAYFSGHREVRFYLLAWIGVVLSSTLMNLRHVLGLEIPQETVYDSMRAVMVLDAMMMGLAIADRYNQLRRSRQVVLEENLSAAQHRLQLNKRLADLQARHELAVEMSKSRDQQIQNVVHDLRQPLHALRLNVMNLNSDAPQYRATAQNMDSAFSYLEKLIAEHLEAAPDNIHSVQDQSADSELGVQQILAAVEEMFRPDAAAKGLSLRRAPSDCNAKVNPLVLTRIVSNLVSNAVKYTSTGGVLIGCRARQNGLRIEIHDTGPGMSQAAFDKAKERTMRLNPDDPATTGKGLGLSIAIELAKRNGMAITLSKLRKTGTGLVLTIPV